MKKWIQAFSALVVSVALAVAVPLGPAFAAKKGSNPPPVFGLDYPLLHGNLDKSMVSDAFGGQLSARNLDQVRFHRYGEESYTVTCLPEGGDPYTEEWIRTFDLDVASTVVRKPNGTVDYFTLTGADGAQTFGGDDLYAQIYSADPRCHNGDPMSKFHYENGSFYWLPPNVQPQFNYQHIWLVGQYNAIDSATLASNF